MGIGILDFILKVRSLLRGGNAKPEQVRELVWQGIDIGLAVLAKYYPRPGVYGSELELAHAELPGLSEEEIAAIQELHAELNQPTEYGANGERFTKLKEMLEFVLSILLSLVVKK